MSFTLDGHTIPTTPATMVRLECDNAMIVTGEHAVGAYLACDECAAAKGPGPQTVSVCRVVAIVPTALVDVRYI